MLAVGGAVRTPDHVAVLIVVGEAEVVHHGPGGAVLVIVGDDASFIAARVAPVLVVVVDAEVGGRSLVATDLQFLTAKKAAAERSSCQGSSRIDHLI